MHETAAQNKAMNAEPPLARFLIKHQLRRPGYRGCPHNPQSPERRNNRGLTTTRVLSRAFLLAPRAVAPGRPTPKGDRRQGMRYDAHLEPASQIGNYTQRELQRPDREPLIFPSPIDHA